MNLFEIVGESKPNNIKLTSSFSDSITELPKSVARRMVDSGILKIKNPESLYVRL